MTAAIAFPRNTASTFLTHLFGTGLADERYVVERFKALACGDCKFLPHLTVIPTHLTAIPA